MAEHPHEGHRQRLKEKFIIDKNSLADHELLELLLFYAVPRKNTNVISKNMIEMFGTLSDLCDSESKDISNVCGVSENTAVLIALVSYMAKRNSSIKINKGNNLKLSSPKIAGEYAVNLFRGEGYELFYLICLNSQKKVVQAALVQKGTLSEVPVYTRLVVELAIRHKAHSVILAHNHPGGSLTPSQDDINITKEIEAAFETISIAVNDHIVVAGEEYISLKEQNYM
jgi:DNA repair protein RadC